MIHQVLAAPKQMSVEKGIEFARTHRLGYEIPGFTEPVVLDKPEGDIKQWQQRLSGFMGPLSMHGPVYDLNPVSLDPLIADASHKRYLQALNVAQVMGCRFLVFHTQYNSLFKVANVEKEWLAASIDYWQRFASVYLTESPTLTVVLENFMEETPEQLRQLVEGINHPQIKACMDTGHCNIYSPVPLVTWLNELEHQLVYVHSHNNFGETDEHRGYAYGTVDMEGFLNAVTLQPYKITLAMEIFHEKELQESFKLVEHYLNIQNEQLSEKTFLI